MKLHVSIFWYICQIEKDIKSLDIFKTGKLQWILEFL